MGCTGSNGFPSKEIQKVDNKIINDSVKKEMSLKSKNNANFNKNNVILNEQNIKKGK